MSKNNLQNEHLKDESRQDRLVSLLTQANFSRAARGRNATKAHFLEQAQPIGSRNSHPMRLTLEIVGLAFLVFGFLFTVSSLVNNRPSAVPGTHQSSCDTVNYTVKNNDTIFGIANNYGMLAQDIQDWNNLAPDMLRVGQVLKIPLCKRLPASSPTSTPSNFLSYPPANSIQANQGSCDTVNYTVQIGDTLDYIAKNFQVLIQDIKDWNNLTPDGLYVRQVLKIPLCKGTKKPNQTAQPASFLQYGINLDTPVESVRIAISQPAWKTLWVEAEIDYAPFSTDTNQPDKRLFSQAWLENAGRGLVLSTDFLPSQFNFNFNLDFRVSAVTLFDRKNLIQYDMSTGHTTTTPAAGTFSLLASSSPALDLVYPGFLAILSSEPRPLRMENLLGRPALVADWGSSRLWVDSQTGLLLKAERYSGEVGNSPLESILTMRQLLIDPPLDDAVFNPPHLNELTFRPAPDTTQPSVTPTPFAEASPDGWVYFQAAGQAPFEWKVYRMPASCLADGSTCPDPQQLPGNPNLQITGLYWAPDHSLAVFSDTNNNQIVAYDPATQQWPRVVQGFFQPQLIWSPDGKQIAALTEGAGPYDMRLVVVNRSDWSVRDVPTTLKGEKRVIGWLDGNTLLLQIMPQDIFKGGTPDWAATDFHPGFYRLDVETGNPTNLLQVDVAQPLSDLTLSPDGKQLTYWHWDEKGLASIYLSAPDGSQAIKTGLQGNFPAWSPDEQWLLFQQTLAGDPAQPQLTTLLLAHPDGSSLHKILESTATIETAWSPDSKVLLISEFDNVMPGSYTLSTFDAETGVLKKLDLPAMTGLGVLNLLGWAK